MKTKILNKALLIIKTNSKINKTREAELLYGLEGLYLTITKLIIIISLSIILNMIKETVIVCLSFNVLRSKGYGVHAKTSLSCLLFSIIFFIIIPLISKYIILSFNTKYIIGIILITLIFAFSPSDTKKRPLINKIKRKEYKLITTIYTILLVFASLYTPYSNLILIGIITEALLINPIIYKCFNIPYNNYKEYNY